MVDDPIPRRARPPPAPAPSPPPPPSEADIIIIIGRPIARAPSSPRIPDQQFLEKEIAAAPPRRQRRPGGSTRSSGSVSAPRARVEGSEHRLQEWYDHRVRRGGTS